MPNDSSTPKADQAEATSTTAPRYRVQDARTRSAVKGAATVRRHKQERHADDLALMREQIADGTLVVRQMTAVQHQAATQTALRTRAQNQARPRFNRGHA